MDGQTDKVSYRVDVLKEKHIKRYINKDDNIHKSEALKR